MAGNNKARGFFGEFQAFIARGNVLDLAVGVIIGGRIQRHYHFAGQRYHQSHSRHLYRRRQSFVRPGHRPGPAAAP